MVYKYIYIDDTNDNIERGTINGLQDGGEIEIAFQKPNDWETQINDLVSNLKNYSGIILDLRLNLVPYEDSKYAQFRGSTVAQELRTLAKEAKFENDFPIILISGDAEIAKSLDQTSLDLFDFTVNKTRLGHSNGLSYSEFRDKLKWMADGYTFLNKSNKTVEAILDIKDASFLDTRFIDIFGKIVIKPVHSIARFLIKQVIERPSFLIDEKYLSARLGVDGKSQDWNNLLTKFLSPLKYSGAFSTYYDRWWMQGIEDFWEEKISSEYFLRSIDAKQRVDLLIEKTGLKNLTPISRQEKSKSDSFWTICKGTNVAIDTIDGLVIANQDSIYPWQEKEYVCINEALRPSNIESWHAVSALEKNRLQKLKDLYGKTEQRTRK